MLSHGAQTLSLGGPYGEYAIPFGSIRRLVVGGVTVD